MDSEDGGRQRGRKSGYRFHLVVARPGAAEADYDENGAGVHDVVSLERTRTFVVEGDIGRDKQRAIQCGTVYGAATLNAMYVIRSRGASSI